LSLEANCSSYYIAKFWSLDITDSKAPSISITAPAGGAELSGIVALQAEATDNVGVTKVDFYIDGKPRGLLTDTAAPWEASWDTAREANGTHALLAKAFDAAGNVGTSSEISVRTTGGIVDRDPPTVNLTA
jgi:Big-like domain-containing protein